MPKCNPARAADQPAGDLGTGDPPSGHAGRRPITDLRHIERVAVGLFSERGFEQTTIDDIAQAAGIGRRTFFRYFSSKNDVIWGEFDAQLTRLREVFASLPDDMPVDQGIARAVIAVNSYPDEVLPDLRRRMAVIAASPTLQAHSAIRYESWKQLVAEYVGGRLGQDPDDLTPRLAGAGALAAAEAAYGYWIARGGDLVRLLAMALDRFATGFRGLGST
jgi:mycofactocin system transcriptional regulator